MPSKLPQGTRLVARGRVVKLYAIRFRSQKFWAMLHGSSFKLLDKGQAKALAAAVSQGADGPTFWEGVELTSEGYAYCDWPRWPHSHWPRPTHTRVRYPDSEQGV